MKKWDLFVSHASEDKRFVALPLANSLIRAGLKVWLDHFELRLGDSLREKIDEGLSRSRFGVVILSPSFLSKGWPTKELNALFALEDAGVKVILPVWHDLDKSAVAAYSPLLADRLAATMKDGVTAVARQIAEVVLREAAGGRTSRTTLAAQFASIIAGRPSPLNIATFLSTYPTVLPMSLGHFGLFPEEAVYRIRPSFDGCEPDLSVGNIRSTSLDWTWRHLFFGPVDGPLFDSHGRSLGTLNETLARLTMLQQWLVDHVVEATAVLLAADHDVRPDQHEHQCLVVAGRRDRLSRVERTGIKRSRDIGVEIRTYDWLIEACVTIDGARSRGLP